MKLSEHPCPIFQYDILRLSTLRFLLVWVQASGAFRLQISLEELILKAAMNVTKYLASQNTNMWLFLHPTINFHLFPESLVKISTFLRFDKCSIVASTVHCHPKTPVCCPLQLKMTSWFYYCSIFNWRTRRHVFLFSSLDLNSVCEFSRPLIKFLSRSHTHIRARAPAFAPARYTNHNAGLIPNIVSWIFHTVVDGKPQ